MNDRDAWLQERRTGIGGSDIGAIIGVSKWSTPLDIYLSKVENVASEETAPMRWGNLLESVVANEFANKTGLRIQRVNKMIHKPGAEWMIANVDRAVVPEGARTVVFSKSKSRLNTPTIVEIKTARDAEDWGDAPSIYDFDDWKDAIGGDEIPLSYAAQIQWYLGITGAGECFVPVLFGGSNFRVYRVAFDKEIFDFLVEAARKFWFDHVIERNPPELTSLDDFKKLYPNDNGNKVEATDEIIQSVARISSLKNEIEKLEAEKDAESLKVAEYLGEATSLEYAGVPLLTFKKSADGVRVDSNVLKAKFPEVYSEVIKPAPGSRRFLLKGN
jgi:putative phage-type endonuclease